MPVLWIVIPFFNEAPTLEPCVERVILAPLSVGWMRALVLVDDHSRDQQAGQFGDAGALAARLRNAGHAVELLRHERNRGKGAALRTGFDRVLEMSEDNDAVIIQDADMEYDPADYPALLEPIIAGEADAVFGTRWGGHFRAEGAWRRMHALGNRLLTRFSNLMTGYHVADMECCYKVMTIPALRRIRPMLSEDGFGVEPQMAAALARIGARLAQRPVRYDPREIGSGKKIRSRDAFRALYVMMRERLRRHRNA
jgi:glycosyltransferase involved in cell wall biosynthesis